MRLVILYLLAVLVVVVVFACGDGRHSTDSLVEEVEVEEPIVPRVFLGVDWFAAGNSRFPCDAALQVYKGVNAPAFGYLWSTFGEEPTCVFRFMEEHARHPHLIRVHITNECCRRNNYCAGGEFARGVSVREYNRLLEKQEGWLVNDYRERVRQAGRWFWLHKNKNTTVLFSVGLEHQLTDKAIEVLRDIIKQEVSYGVVSNPVDDNSKHGADVLELHSAGVAEQPCIGALDGVDIYESGTSFRKRWKRSRVLDWAKLNARYCRAVLLWSARSQGLGSNWGFIKPRLRDFQLPASDIQLLNGILLEVQNGVD